MKRSVSNGVLFSATVLVWSCAMCNFVSNIFVASMSVMVYALDVNGLTMRTYTYFWYFLVAKAYHSRRAGDQCCLLKYITTGLECNVCNVCTNGSVIEIIRFHEND